MDIVNPIYIQILALIAALASAAAAFFSAFLMPKQLRLMVKQINQSDKQSKQRSTVDTLLREKENSFSREIRSKFADLRRVGTDFTKLACEFNNHNKNIGNGEQEEKIQADNDVVLTILNNYEFMCLGVKKGVFDEELYCLMNRSNLLRDWKCLRLYIEKLRDDTEIKTLYCEFEWLAKRWENEKQ
ncbi:DUF4760 domain-containing protein [Neisseria sp. Ec49-e6-T10]|uniref:DUF4760 domain-containing protein n=1 Tax=Neisseria sp. Ec49-e6-T10 TaxID=3140744 RepID=UPI003EBFD31F